MEVGQVPAFAEQGETYANDFQGITSGDKNWWDATGVPGNIQSLNGHV